MRNLSRITPFEWRVVAPIGALIRPIVWTENKVSLLCTYVIVILLCYSLGLLEPWLYRICMHRRSSHKNVCLIENTCVRDSSVSHIQRSLSPEYWSPEPVPHHHTNQDLYKTHTSPSLFVWAPIRITDYYHLYLPVKFPSETPAISLWISSARLHKAP